jgi:nucleoid-associated protein YgaU
VASGKGAAAPPELRAAVPAPAHTGASGATTERSARAAQPDRAPAAAGAQTSPRRAENAAAPAEAGPAAPVPARPGEVAAAIGAAVPRATPDTTPGAAAAPGAPAVLLADREGVRMLQPAAPGAQPVDRVTVDVISYAADGAVLLEGRSAPPPPPVDSVRVYLDGAPVDSAPIGADGTWRLPIADLRSGLYTLRVDQLDRSGRVVSRFETPFKREDPADLARLETGAADAPGQTALRARLITVQPGYTLWGIASDRYGSGFEYVHIFEANDDQIRDPDLIYPGQIFDLPALPDEN